MKKILFIEAICLLCSISVFSQSKKKWEQTKIINSIGTYQAFINKYPDSNFSDSAKLYIERLVEKEAKEKQELQLQEAKRRELQARKIADAKAVDEKIILGITMEEVISLLSMQESVNRNSGGGLFIGMGVFPKNENEKSTYTGNASLDGYDIVFEKGKVVSKKIVPERLGSQMKNFSYTIKF